jgi:hypothetical protein
VCAFSAGHKHLYVIVYNTIAISVDLPKRISMRKQFALLLCTMLSIVVASQSPQKFSYQSVIRNAGNQLVVNQQVGGY